MTDDLKPLIDLLIKSVEDSSETFKKELIALRNEQAIINNVAVVRLDELKVALEKQNILNMSAGEVVSTSACNILHQKVIHEMVEYQVNVNNKIKWSWIVLTFILGPVVGILGWLTNIMFKHFLI